MQLHTQNIRVGIYDSSGGSLGEMLAAVLNMADEPRLHADLTVAPELSRDGIDVFVVLGEASRGMLKQLRELYQEAHIVVIQESRTIPTLIALLGAGADDVLYTNTLSVDEICMFLRVRIRHQVTCHNRGHDGPVTVGDLSVDPLARRVQIGSDEISLSPREFRLLYMLAKSAGAVLTHDAILVAEWGPGCIGARELLRAALWRLRGKTGPKWIITHPGVGYMMPLPQGEKAVV